MFVRQMVAFDDQFKKKGRDEDTVKHMWAVVAAMAHWLMTTELGPWIGCEDGDRIMKTVSAIGTMFLTALNELDKAGLLKADSPIEDLGLVMAVYLEWSSDLGEYGLGEDDEDDDEDEEKPSWRTSVVAYAKKAGIDLGESGVFSANELVSSLEEDNGGSIAPLAGQAKADRWGWKKTLASLKKLSPKFGGKEYDITQWTRAERAKHAFDKKDPLANIPEKELKAGNIKMA
ncbi:hypothetical protein PG993_000856 [Apiospora rasikravindrae]|uniref:Uncharacterized protein n=1 Tax=Apiospora rasikravindrae TaxID=990691 RepID=A0ABR1U9S5_9PEZI